MKHPKIAGWVLTLAMALGPATVQGNANCVPEPPTVVAIPMLDVPANPIPGQILGDPNGYAFGLPHALRCTYSGLVIGYYTEISLARETVSANRRVSHFGLNIPVFRTGVAGVGFGVVAQDEGDWQTVGTGTSIMRGPIYPPHPSWGVRGRVFFFVTGPITGGVLLPRNLASLKLYTDNNRHLINLGASLIGPPRPPTCTVSTPSLNMDLGIVPNREFTGVGSSAGSASATIELQCADGTGAQAEVLVTLTDQTEPGNRSNQLSLLPTSTARGVALQLVHNGTAVAYGADSNALGNLNQWRAGSTDNGTFQIQLTARYLQTAPVIAPGTAMGVATFTLSYR